MSFDTKKFRNQKFEHRTEAVEVPELQAFFGEKEKPVFTVRGLTGVEFGRARESAKNHERMVAALEAIRGGKMSEQVQGFRDLIGVGADAPADITEKIEIVMAGTVTPVLERNDAVLICERFPTVFYSIANKIISLTGLGQKPGERGSSGKAPESEQG